MQKRLFIYLYPSLKSSWIILDETNHILQSVEDDDLTQLSAVNKELETFVIVPSQDVLLVTATLPKLSRSRLMQALPFALEEQLIEDINKLHFAIGEYQTDGTLPVAVVSHKKMIEWKEFFEKAGISTQYYLPSIFLLPFKELHWYINSNASVCLARTGKFSGFACEPENETCLLDLKLAEDSQKNSITQVRTDYSNHVLLEKNAKEITSFPFINLLQGSYQAKQQTSKIKYIWLLAAYFAIAWVTLAFTTNIIAFFVLHHRASKIETEINAIYKQHFPQAKSIVAPRERMTEKLKTVAGNINKNNLLGLLGAIGKGLSQAPGVHVQGLDFREQQLTLELTAPSFDNLDVFTKVLTQQGLSVKQQNATIAGSQVKSTFLIRVGSI